MVNRFKVDATWVPITSIPDFAPLYRSAGASAPAVPLPVPVPAPAPASEAATSTMMPASAPKGFFYYTPPDKTPIKVKTRDIAKHVGKLTKKSMVNRIKVDSTWVKAKTLPDFAPLLAASSTNTPAVSKSVSGHGCGCTPG